jgi:hypothetical protein
MSEYTVDHKKNPRETELYPAEGRHSAVRLSLTRHGVVVDGYYDSFVGIEGFFVSWEEFDKLRAQTLLPFKAIA